MSLTGSPAAGSFVEVTEQYPADSNSAVATTEPVSLGSRQGTIMTVGTGGPDYCSVQASLVLTLAAGTPQSIDLKAIPSRAGSKSFTKVRRIRFEETADADSVGTVTVLASAADAWTDGPFSAAGTPLAKNSELFQTNRSTAGWAVTATNKVLTFDPGANAAVVKIALLGE